MAAIRSALVMLGRRSCGSSGSASAAASLGGRGMEIYQAFRPSAQRTPPLPSLRPPSRYRELWPGIPKCAQELF
ncbi:hypothetical protein U9M48_021080 [Paspalum notatum var. saurae]|uniref:Uncharacterized protein n=1 Tax=Paspalum notatum var. saurae TaxID=547442 RepID=A0AAQ3WSD3_PASNO